MVKWGPEYSISALTANSVLTCVVADIDFDRDVAPVPSAMHTSGNQCNNTLCLSLSKPEIYTQNIFIKVENNNCFTIHYL